MRRASPVAAVLTLALLASPAAAQAPAKQSPAAAKAIATALADPARPAEDKARDANRKPAETLVFGGVKAGDTVAELIPGGGYYTRLLAKTVGPKGHVYALVSTSAAARTGALDKINAVAAAYKNVTVIPVDFTSFTVPKPVDVVWTSENYHDLHNGPTANIAAFNAAVAAALKPGGVFYVEDHAAPGTGVTATSTLHRIDPMTVIAEVTASGLQLDGRSAALANPSDPHTASVLDPSIRGKTDRFILRFRKPKG